MTSTRLIAVIIVFVVLLVVLLQGTYVLSHQRAQLVVAQQRTENLNRQLAARDRVRDATVGELTLAEKQLGELSHIRPSAPTASASISEAEFAPWIARVKRLQQLVEQHTDQRIPEMRMLTDDDWLTVARNRKLDSEEDVRPALAAIRTAAKDRFVVALVEAMRRFNAAATSGQTVVFPQPGRGGATTGRTPPATAMDLAPYLENPADAEVLIRLAVFPNNSGWKLQERDAIDSEYDGGYWINSDVSGVRGSVTRPPWAWLPPDFDERSLRANRAYLAAHNDLHSAGYAEVIPYFDPPLEPAIAEKILRAERPTTK